MERVTDWRVGTLRGLGFPASPFPIRPPVSVRLPIPIELRAERNQLVTSSRWPEVELLSSYTIRPGTTPNLGERLRATVPWVLYRLPNTVFFFERGALRPPPRYFTNLLFKTSEANSQTF